MYFNYKLWLVNGEGKKVFGNGPVLLLKKVSKLGSLNKAALEMGMSYSKALSIIKNAEGELSISLLNRRVGGSHGGGSSLTDDARELIRKYDEFTIRGEEVLKSIYKEVFK